MPRNDLAQPAMPAGAQNPRPPLPDRAPLRPQAYLAITAGLAVNESTARVSRRGSAAAGTGALMSVSAAFVAAIVATLAVGAWLLVTSLAG